MTRKLVPFLLFLFALPAVASVDYVLSINSNSVVNPVDPGARARVSVFVSPVCCHANDPTEATVTIPLPPGSTNITAPGEFGGWACSVAGATVTCTTHLAATPPYPGIIVDFNVPSSLDGIGFRGQATLATTVTDDHPESNVADVVVSVYRLLTVTTADDFGAGSLRDALTQANTLCDTSACKMIFAGPMTIEPKSPLPAITVGIVIDGGIAAGTSLAVERPVEISGTKAGFANGLEIRTFREVTLRGITINGFAANGLVLAEPKSPPASGQQQIRVEGCFIGTNTTATEARPNGMRGIAIETPFTNAWISNCTISGNRYSGMAIWDASRVFISLCRVGVGRAAQPLGNGASGIYIDGGYATVDGTIAYNHDFGVAVGPHAQHADVDANGIFANAAFDYDWGLDGPTRTDPSLRMPPAPVLTEATYDLARNVTVIRGVVPAEGRKVLGQYSVRIFEATANSRVVHFPQANLGNAASGDLPFTLNIPGDLRGRTIEGQTFYYEFADGIPLDSSELGAPVVVH
jgi:hypothetical protein